MGALNNELDKYHAYKEMIAKMQVVYPDLTVKEVEDLFHKHLTQHLIKRSKEMH